MADQAKKSARHLAGDKVLDVASDLFYREGIRAVGVETLVAKAGVAKISLYRNFASKDELVVAYLDARAKAYWSWWDDLVAVHAGDYRAQIRALMYELVERTTEIGYRGCPFLNCAIEFPDSNHSGHQAAVEVKHEIRRRLLLITRGLGARDAGRLADSLLLLIEGAYAISQTLDGPQGPMTALAWAADALVDAQLAHSTPASGAF